MTQDILVDRGSNGLAVVTLNRPTKRNAINFAMWCDLKMIFDDLSAAADIRAVILTGAGGNFSAGAD
ncbi:MAG: enoyl-CoA hydratase/isomerase family protein, partial [Candidatus Saccharimonadales bacterium]